MSSRSFIDLAFVSLLYALYAGVAIWIYGVEQLSGDDRDIYPLVALGVSLLAFLAWYVLGEWGIKATASRVTFYALWWVLLAVILVTAAVVSFLELGEAGKDAHSSWVAYPLLHFVGAVGAYYAASVLFSPRGATYLIWPSHRVRTW